MDTLKICHLYPDTLNLYGDRGNILCMKKRMEWRGLPVEIAEISVGEQFDPYDYDIYFIGGGQDFEQEVLLKDLAGEKGAAIKRAVDEEKVFLTICGGYQILGNYYKTWDGVQCDFLGAIDVYTVGEKKRMVGDFMFQLSEEDGGSIVTGFENHSGKTYLGKDVRPLGKILRGHGNNGEDGTEGARFKNVFASYSHGPLLPKNPKLCDFILKTALARKDPNISLKALDDTFENRAAAFMEKRLSAE